MKKIVKIVGMSCGHCANRVEKALKEFKEIAEVVVDIEGKNAILDLTDEISDEQIRQAIEEVGYDVMEIQRI